MALQVTKKTTPLRGLSITVDDVRRIVEKLQRQVEEERKREVARLLENEPNDQAHREQIEANCLQAFQINVTIYGTDGESLSGYGTELFDSPDIAEPIDSIYISNSAAFQSVTGHDPLNKFTLNLDFSTPPLVDNNNPVSNPTPNFSNLTVEGDQDAWIASIREAVIGILDKKSNRRSFMHGAFVYDIGLVLLGFPAAIYMCWRCSDFVEVKLGVLSPFISTAAYIYIVFFVLSVYRVLFGYTKWAFPTVELTDNKSGSKTHRKFWVGIVLSLLASAIYDLPL